MDEDEDENNERETNNRKLHQFRKGHEKKRKEIQTKITETEKIKMSFQTKHTHTVDQIRFNQSSKTSDNSISF